MSLNVIHLLGYVELCYGSVGLGLVRLGYFLVTQMGKFYKLTEKSLFKWNLIGMLMWVSSISGSV